MMHRVKMFKKSQISNMSDVTPDTPSRNISKVAKKANTEVKQPRKFFKQSAILASVPAPIQMEHVKAIHTPNVVIDETQSNSSSQGNPFDGIMRKDGWRGMS